MLWLILLVMCVFSQSLKDQGSIVKEINGERTRLGLGRITYNTNLQSELEIYKNVFTPSWYFQPADWINKSVIFTWKNETIATRVRNLNGEFILLYSTFDYFTDHNWKFVFRDSMVENIAPIIKFRLNQRECFNFKTCENQFCLKEKPVLENSKKCSYAFYYYNYMVDPNMKEISCISLDIAGPAVPNHLIGKQNKTFACYARFNK